MLTVYEEQLPKFERQLRSPDPEWKVTHELQVRSWSPLTESYDEGKFNRFLVFIVESIANTMHPLFRPLAGLERQLDSVEQCKFYWKIDRSIG